MTPKPYCNNKVLVREACIVKTLMIAHVHFRAQKEDWSHSALEGLLIRFKKFQLDLYRVKEHASEVQNIFEILE